MLRRLVTCPRRMVQRLMADVSAWDATHDEPFRAGGEPVQSLLSRVRLVRAGAGTIDLI